MTSIVEVGDLASLADEINKEAAAVESNLRQAVGHAIRCGELLVRAKATVPHGRWLTWLQGNTTVSARTAQLYMRVAERRDELADGVSLREAARLLAEPKQGAEEDAQRVADSGTKRRRPPMSSLSCVPLDPQPAGPMLFHPLAEEMGIRMLDAEELQGLADSIAENGLFSSITLYEGKILDGRGRYLACLVAGVTPHFSQLAEGEDPARYLYDMNICRQHFTKAELAAAWAKVDGILS